MNNKTISRLAVLIIVLIFQSLSSFAQLKVIENGNAGIGTDNPTAKLMVKGIGDRILKLFNSSNAEILTALDNGNIGLGHTVPNQRLTVSGNIQLYGGIDQRRYIIMNGGASGRQILTIQAGAGSNTFGGAINLYGNEYEDHPGDVAIGLSSNGSSSFRINTTGLDRGTNRFFVQNDGKVGIGRLAPSSYSHLINNDLLHIDGGVQIENNSGTHGLTIYRGADGEGPLFNIVENGNSSLLRSLGDLKFFVGPFDALYNLHEEEPRSASAFGPQAMVITASGNVGIGTTINAEPTQRLQVNGNVQATAFIAAGGQIWPDYVFHNYFAPQISSFSGHRLMPLSELKDYISSYYHLPGIPSLQDVKDNGMNINVGETAVKNLEKIEELTLYAIEANDQIIALKAENNILREEVQKQIRALETKNDETLKNNLNQDQKIKQLFEMITQLTAEQSKVSVN